MIRIAVVGDIGCGKGYVAKQFGYPVFNADTEVTRLYKKSKKCYSKLKKCIRIKRGPFNNVWIKWYFFS